MSTPFDVFYQEMMTQIQSDAQLLAMTQPRNIIDYDDVDGDPRPRRIQTADTPEILCYLKGITGNLHSTSCSVTLNTVWAFVVSTGEYNSQLAHAANFTILKVVSNWKDWGFPLEWRSKKFVHDLNLVTADSGESNRQENRNISGWATLLDINVVMTIDANDLLLGHE